MRFERRIDHDSEICPFSTLDRHLRRRDLPTERRADAVRAELFTWDALLRTRDPDRLAWRNLQLVREGDSLRLRFEYNWALQALAQCAATAFTFAFMQRFGNAEATSLVVCGLNAGLFAAAAWSARAYAKKLTRELETALRA